MPQPRERFERFRLRHEVGVRVRAALVSH